MARPDVNGTQSEPNRTLLGVVTIVGLLVVLVGVAGGIGPAIAVLGLSVLGVGLIAVVRGEATWAKIVGRRTAGTVAVAGLLAAGIGGVLTPSTETANTAAEAAAPESPTATPAPKSVQPLVAAPTTSQTPVRPPAPVMTMTCPTGGTNAAPVYGQQIAAAAPYSVTISYGDGDSYTNDDQHLGAVFSHTYQAAGSFTVQAVLTDAVGQTTSASCTYTWTAPVVVPPSAADTAVGGTGGGAGSGSGDSTSEDDSRSQDDGSSDVHYKNCDAVRAAGAAPIYPFDPGWDDKFDRDHDGIGCE